MNISKLLTTDLVTSQMMYANLFANNQTACITMRAGMVLNKPSDKQFRTIIAQVDEITQELEVCGLKINPGICNVIESTTFGAINALSLDKDTENDSCCLIVDVRHEHQVVNGTKGSTVICYVSLVLFETKETTPLLNDIDDIKNTVFTLMIPVAGNLITSVVTEHIENFKINEDEDEDGDND